MKTHKPGLKINIHYREGITKEGFKRWSIKLRPYIAKSPWTWRHYASTADKMYVKANGCNYVPNEILKDDKTLVEFLLDNFLFTQGTYKLHGHSHRKTKYKSGFSGALMFIAMYDPEKRIYEIYRSGNLNRYAVRRHHA